MAKKKKITTDEVTVTYSGHKDRFPVLYPIGVKKLSLVERIEYAAPSIKMTRVDAEKLIRLSPLTPLKIEP
jgi:hypothetical protein